MTHIENIPHILKNGITHATSKNSNPNFKAIGDNSLIAERNNHVLKNGRSLGEYIPFYFGVRTPMLYVVQKGFNFVSPTSPEHIVYCVSSVQKIMDLGLDFVFTDGHAIEAFSSQYTVADVNDIDRILDKNAIDARYWNAEDDLDKKRRKQAEFLVLGDVSLEAILGYVTYSENVKSRMIEFGIDPARVHVRPQYYF